MVLLLFDESTVKLQGHSNVIAAYAVLSFDLLKVHAAEYVPPGLGQDKSRTR